MTTTTTKAQPIESITHIIDRSAVLSDSTATDAELDRLAQTTADALAEAFPGVRVECPIQGATATPTRIVMTEAWHRGEGAGHDWLAEERAREEVEEIAGRVWQKWCESLAPADAEEV